MKAHVIHDKKGTIKSIVFPSTELEGGLEISSGDEGEDVTIVELHEGTGATNEELASLAEEIRTKFRVDPGKKSLERLK